MLMPERENEIKAEKIIAEFKVRFSHTSLSSHRFWAELYHAIDVPLKELFAEIDRLRAVAEERNKWVVNQSQLMSDVLKERDQLRDQRDTLIAAFESIAVIDRLRAALDIAKEWEEWDQLRSDKSEAQLANRALQASVAHLRDKLAVAVDALVKCKSHVGLDDPNWNNLNALAFAARCGLVDIEIKQALANIRGEK